MLVCAVLLAGQASAPQQKQAQPATDEWTAAFDGNALDTTKWERFSFEGGNGGTFNVSGGQLQMRAIPGSRCGVRTRRKFSGQRFIVEAMLAKVGPPLPEPNTPGLPPGFANLTVLFDDSGRNRVEWIYTSDNRFEAWAVVDGVSERLDNRNLATKIANPNLGIVRRGDDFMFMLNGQMGLQRTVKRLPRDFWVMLYGYGSSENAWTSARVVTLKEGQ
ncbi:MAG: hypothetical protein JOY79_01140 [Acidobacteriaceae bacterium]|nr:hypothetical protein [Acidobacteriaceae bacterium]